MKLQSTTGHEVRPPEHEHDVHYPGRKLRLPAFLRPIWEWKEDLAIVNTWLLIIGSLEGVALILLGIALWFKVHEPTRVIVDLPGYVVWPKTELLQLREELLRTFLNQIGKVIYEVSPGSYEIQQVVDKISPGIAKVFRDYYGPIATGRNAERIVWTLREIRRYEDSKHPGYLTIAGKCDRARYRIENGAQEIVSEQIVIVFYLVQVPNTPTNPLGLRLEGVEEFKGAEADKAWALTSPIVSPDLLKKESPLGAMEKHP
ncbi:hypothetical protein MAMC_01013 [Methylacidimicrobium cyclopophantes]|uniref:Bacterial virulence protein VirB8 domain-containing protein n=1 Tax=Methylacidimicrobium cyclopophantes TaxID=1041766 RepID=A0A5E6MEK1_9BACT|nr:hypothetical protein [Methylacidimicrobium cyclopophantes]VVM06253.1 hypothetical protein MAMC_01013 [Methylacidimicrobium cyclopophantes]